MAREANLVIIADNDPDDSLFLLTALLSMSPELTVITVPSGDRLINILEFVSPEYIFLDVNMPKKNGFDTLKDIRSNKKSDQAKVIMCSTSSSVHDISRSQKLGADLYVVKPNSVKHLGKMVDEIFNRDWTATAHNTIPESSLTSHVE